MDGHKPQYWIFSVYLLFLLVGIPWYWPQDNIALLLGIPVWAFISIFIALLSAIFTAWIFLYPPDSKNKSDRDLS